MKQMFIQKEKSPGPEPIAGRPVSYLFSLKWLILLISLTAFAPAVLLAANITGKVTGDGNQPLSGVSVQVKNTSRGTTTDAQGNYSIEASATDVLVVSYVGYATQEITVGNRAEVNVLMATAGQALNEVVVIGYGTQKKRDLTGSIATVSGNDIAKLPSTNPVSSLQGKVAGLTVVNSGQAGSAPTVRIRGVNSTNNADPLYVVDGILQTNIDYLNQADIESMEILKDPSSIAIYGLQGGNGVIIITTRRAKRGETRINFITNTGFQKLVNKIDVTDADGFKNLYAQQLQNIGAQPFDFKNYTANTDWQDQIYRTAFFTNNSLSISNTTDKATTYLNVGYSNQDGILKFDNYKKYIARLNEEIRITNNIKVGGEINGFYYNQRPPADGIENAALWASPIIPIKAADGLYYSQPSFQRAQVGNPVAAIDLTNGNTRNTGYRFTGNVFAEIKFLKNFTWRSTFYTDLSFNQARGYTPLPYRFINLGEGNIATDTSFNDLARTGVSQNQSTYKTFQQDHTLTFDKNLGDHHLTVLAGFSTLYHYFDMLNASASSNTLNIPDNADFWYLSLTQPSNPATINYDPNDLNKRYQGEDASTSYLARVNYSFKNRYLLNLTYRRDGTSKFSPSNKWGNFGSVGAGWVMTDEDFLKGISWLNFLKLKASYGTVGNGLNIGNYLYYPALNTANVGIFGNNVYPSVTAAYVPDPNLHWEKVEGKDVGAEARFLNNKINFEVDFYDRKTHDILTSITLPGASGNTSYFTNLGTIDNRGVEVTAGWNDRIGKDFSYSISGNLSYNKNKVESIGNGIDFQLVGANGVNYTTTGQSIGYFYGYVQTGIYQTTAELDKTPHLAAAQPGDISFKDVNNDGKIDQNDRTYLGTPFPKWNFGGNVTVSYKGFDLGVDLQGVAGNKIYVQRRTATFAILNYESNRLNAWHGAGTTNVEPILDNTHSVNYLFSSYWLEPGDYFRIRTIQLGYNLRNGLPAIGLKNLRVFVSGQNIATFSHATGYTPEVPVNNPINAGADNGVYPVPAIYSAGLNVTF